MASSLLFSATVFSSNESPAAGHKGLQRSPERSSTRSRNVRFQRCFNVKETQVSAMAEEISGPRHMEEQSMYGVLGISRGATAKDIKRAYRKLAKEFHPDLAVCEQEKERNTQMFVRIHTAYVTLSDPNDRAQYDQQLWGQVRGFTGQTRSKATDGRQTGYGRVGRNWETNQCW